MVEGVFKDLSVRIVSGPYQSVELELNKLLLDYAVLVWNFAVIADQIHITAVLVHQREIRKMQIAMSVMGMGNQHH